MSLTGTEQLIGMVKDQTEEVRSTYIIDLNVSITC